MTQSGKSTSSASPSNKPQDSEAIKPLKPQHDRFARRMADGNTSATQAYMEAYPKSSKEAARKHAPRLVANGDVGKAIIHYMKEKGLDDNLAGSTLHELVTQKKDGKLRHQALRTYLELTGDLNGKETNQIAVININKTVVPSNHNNGKDLRQ